MSRFVKTLLLSGLPIVLTVFGTSALLMSGAHNELRLPSQISTQTADSRRARNLSLQPEASRMSRVLGKRFLASSGGASVFTGNLTTGRGPQPVTIVRRQTATGETVQIGLVTRSFNWSDLDGVTALTGEAPTQVERLLVERFIFDSADQFILAQLRGASYSTVARNARPVEAGASENYSGPVWNIVRITDAERDPRKRPVNPSRLYYINSNTGLIEKIVTESGIEPIEVFLSDWIAVSGEKVPTNIVWKHQAETVMQFALTSFTRVPEQ
jgi:hypothetical protein